VTKKKSQTPFSFFIPKFTHKNRRKGKKKRVPKVQLSEASLLNIEKKTKMAASLQLLQFKPVKPSFSFFSRRSAPIICSAAPTPSKSQRSYTITLLPGDGIGPEVISVAKDVLILAGSLEGTAPSLFGIAAFSIWIG